MQLFLFRSGALKTNILNHSSEKKALSASGTPVLKNIHIENTANLPGVTEKDLFISKDDDREWEAWGLGGGGGGAVLSGDVPECDLQNT